MTTSFASHGTQLRYRPETAPARYAGMGLPDEYKITLHYKWGSGGEWRIYLYKWGPRYKDRLLLPAKYIGDGWVLQKSQRVSLIFAMDDISADVIAEAWIYEILRVNRLQKKQEQIDRVNELEGY